MSDTPTLQVADDPALLDLMLEDLSSAPEAYRPTNYWAVYQQRFVPELRSLGLRDFRRRFDSVLRSFGAVDFANPIAKTRVSGSRLLRLPVVRSLPGIERLGQALDRRLGRYIRTLDDLDLDSYTRLGYAHAHLKAEGTHARPLREFSMSLAGNPVGVVEIEGRHYSRTMLRYYLQYVYMSRFVDFETIGTVAELGSGMGRQTEVVCRLHPRVSYLLFDLPPQLYVAEQFLSAVFPERVVSYRATREWTRLETVPPGSICLLGSAQMPLLETGDLDLFVNAASFHEMEPDVVRNYLSHVNARTKWAYLSENLATVGKARQAGDLGVMKQTVLEDYVEGLSNFELLDQRPCEQINGKPMQEQDMMFRRVA